MPPHYTQHFTEMIGSLGGTGIFLQVVGVWPSFLFLLMECRQEVGGGVFYAGSWLAHEIVGKRNLSFSGFFSPPTFQNPYERRGLPLHAVCAKKNEDNTNESKRETEYIISKISSHLGRPASKGHLWRRLQHFLAVEFLVSVCLILKFENDICDRK